METLTESAMRRPLAALWIALAAAAAPASADPVVVELYTSQGCSSCPPADALLHDLAKYDDVIPLALHVDYWDFIGWPDSFAQPAFGARQKAYARVNKSRTVFTPHMVVGGVDHIIGAEAMALMDRVQAHAEASKPVRLSLASTADGPVIMAQSEMAFETPVDLILVSYTASETVDIRHGENAGRVLTYTNIVRAWEPLGNWDGAEAINLPLPDPVEGQHRVVLAQAAGPGAILAALRLD